MLRSLRIYLAAIAAFSAPAFSAPLPNGVEYANGGALLRVEALDDGIVRVRMATNGRLPEDASWAVSPAVRANTAPVTQTATGFRTSMLAVEAGPSGLRVSDNTGHSLLSDAGLGFSRNGPAFTLWKKLRPGERIYGMGDKTGSFDRSGQSFVNWNTDAWGFNRGTDPIYKSIPFYIGVAADGGAYGLFLDNIWRSWFDFGHRNADTIEIGADGGPIDYYVIAGPTVRDVVRRYAGLTGKSPLPPLWSLGFQQSRYSYMSATEVKQVADRLRRERVPSDVIWLDIDYQDRNRPFTTNPRTYPDLKGLAGDVGKQGFKLVAITDLHVASAPNQGYAPYDSGVAGDHFLKNPDGSTYVAPVWPGPSVFPDFTRASSRAWWGSLYAKLADDGIAGFWNDMNEPAIFDTPSKTMPLGTVHRIDGDGFAPRTASHAEVHNVYGMENSRATHDGLLSLRPNVRPFVMTRASYAGGQRYAVTWTGDNSSSWDHLKLAVQQMLSLGLSGFSWSGADIPGFIGGASPELATRWFQIAAFTPVYRAHAANDAPRGEPWVDGASQLAIRRNYIEARYRLLPYLYAVAEEGARTGDPVMRPTFYDYPAMVDAPCDQSMAFTLGSDLLIAASPKPDSPKPYDICLPAEGWYDYWTGQRLNSTKTRETPALARLPVFVRPGAIIPRQPLVQSTAEVPHGPLELHVYPGRPGDDCRGQLYLDDGVSITGPSLRQTVGCTLGKDGIMIHFDDRQGSFAPWWKQITVTVHGWSGPARVRGATAVVADRTSHSVRITIPDQPRAADFVLSRF